jgi:hypothetical protein
MRNEFDWKQQTGLQKENRIVKKSRENLVSPFTGGRQ